jgi:hypothetical protein
MPQAPDGFAVPIPLGDILLLQIILIKIIVCSCSGRFAQRHRQHVTDSIPDPSAARPHSRPLCVLSAGPKNLHPPNLVDLKICIQRNPP